MLTDRHAMVALILWCLIIGAPARAQFVRPSPGEVPAGVTVDRNFNLDGALRRLKFEDDANPQFVAWVWIDRGTLVFSVRLRDQDHRSRVLYGRDVIRIALHEFGPRVRAIEARWTEGENRRAYDAARAAGLSKRSAARTTWAARTLARFGYVSVGRVRVRPMYEGADQVFCRFRRTILRRCADALAGRRPPY